MDGVGRAIDCVYFNRFWSLDGDAMPPGGDLAFFVFNVNAGHLKAVREPQRALGVAVDGVPGPTTRSGLAAAPDLPILFRAYCDRQRAFYRALAPRSGWCCMARRLNAASMALFG